LLKAYYRKA
jgi:protein-histidine N-methyltransferase